MTSKNRKTSEGLEKLDLPQAAIDRLPFTGLDRLKAREKNIRNSLECDLEIQTVTAEDDGYRDATPIEAVAEAEETEENEKITDRLRTRLDAMDILWRIDSAQPATASKVFEILKEMPDEGLEMRAHRLRDDLYDYLREIDRQSSAFTDALAAWASLSARIGSLQAESGVMTTDELSAQADPFEARAAVSVEIEKLGVRVNEMRGLLTACVDSPLYILRALQEILDNSPPEYDERMPGYHLDLPLHELPLMPWALLENNLAEVYLLPIGFDEREACAAAGHETAWKTLRTIRAAARRFKKDKVWAEVHQDIYIIDTSFITLHNTLRFKRRKKELGIDGGAQPATEPATEAESVKI